MKGLKCIYCGKEAKFITFGCSICFDHLEYMGDQVPMKEEFIRFIEKNKGIKFELEV